MKYYLIPADLIEKLEGERVNIHTMLGNILTPKQRMQVPVVTLTERMWRVTHRRWKSINLPSKIFGH